MEAEEEEEEDAAGEKEEDAAGEEDEEVEIEEEKKEGVSSCLRGCSSDSLQEDEVGSVGERGGEGDIVKSETGLVSVRSGDSALALLILLLMIVDSALLLMFVPVLVFVLVCGDDVEEEGEEATLEPDKGTFLIVDWLMVLLLAFLMMLLNCATRESVRFCWGVGSWNEDLAVMSDPGELARGDDGVRDGEGRTLGVPGGATDVQDCAFLPYMLIFLEWRLMTDVPLGRRTSGLECRLALTVVVRDVDDVHSCCD